MVLPKTAAIYGILKGMEGGGCQIWRQWSRARRLVKADLAAHGFDELRGVVTDAVFEDDLNLFDVFDIGRGVPLQHDDVGGFAGSQRANFIELAEEFGAVRSGDVNGLERREACLDEKLFHSQRSLPCFGGGFAKHHQSMCLAQTEM
jgi:hypothetical protein